MKSLSLLLEVPPSPSSVTVAGMHWFSDLNDYGLAPPALTLHRLGSELGIWKSNAVVEAF